MTNKQTIKQKKQILEITIEDVKEWAKQLEGAGLKTSLLKYWDNKEGKMKIIKIKKKIMGYTEFTKSKIQSIIDTYNPKNVIDLGSQNDHTSTVRPMPYISGWYKEKGMFYECIDTNGENDSWRLDLSKPFSNQKHWEWRGQYVYRGYDLLVDAGTSEHVSGEDGKFSLEAIYNCWRMKHHPLLRNDWIMYNENPKTGNWPLHGVNYYSQEFYTELVKVADYEILDLGEHPAMNNYVDGWNIFCTLKKIGDKFPSLDEFSKLPIYKS